MVPKNSDSTATTAYGKTLETPIPYSFNWTEYADGASLAAAGDGLSIEEQVKVRNVERKSKARQAALTAALDAAGIVKPDIKNDEQLRLKEFVKVLMSSGKYTDEQARALASSTLGVEWETE
jgi:hypothetical protein